MLFGCLLASSFLFGAFYRWWWILGVAPLVILWLVAAILGLFHVGFAFRDEHRIVTERMRAALAIPLAITLVIVLHQLLAIGPRSAASLYLAAHSNEMRSAQAAAGPNRPAAIRYIEGIPDGGTAIIRSPHVRPERLPVSTQLQLTGERIRACRSIAGNAYACGFD